MKLFLYSTCMRSLQGVLMSQVQHQYNFWGGFLDQFLSFGEGKIERRFCLIQMSEHLKNLKQSLKRIQDNNGYSYPSRKGVLCKFILLALIVQSYCAGT